MFVAQINEFKTMLTEIKNILKSQSKEIASLKEELKDHGKKFKACSVAFNQTKKVCCELTERICEASGTISELQWT